MLHSKIHRLVHSILNKKELPQQGKEYIIATIYKNSAKLTVAIIEEFYELHTIYTSLSSG